MRREIIVLANSVREGGRCVAGICRETKEWIRPIYSVEKEEIKEKEVAHINLGQIVEINLQGDTPIQDDIQGENWLIDSSASTNWQPIGTESLSNIRNLCLNEEIILHSHDNRVSSTIMENLKEKKTLTLIETQVNFVKDGYRWRGHFSDKNNNFLNLTITDPVATKRLSSPNEPKESNCLLTISLARPYYGYCYKLIAGVIWC